jgi:hypothetical protein
MDLPTEGLPIEGRSVAIELIIEQEIIRFLVVEVVVFIILRVPLVIVRSALFIVHAIELLVVATDHGGKFRWSTTRTNTHSLLRTGSERVIYASKIILKVSSSPP